ncbi:MAG: response regulator [Cyanobacteria bacterium P01_A01_bin.114]
MSPKRILLIDDEASIHVIVQISLQTEANWVTLTATSGAEGLVRAKAEQPDAILLDMMLTNTDGNVVLSSLKANPQTCDIPVILLTAQSEPSAILPAALTAAAGIIPKPFNSLTLAAQIAALLGW